MLFVVILPVLMNAFVPIISEVIPMPNALLKAKKDFRVLIAIRVLSMRNASKITKHINVFAEEVILGMQWANNVEM